MAPEVFVDFPRQHQSLDVAIVPCTTTLSQWIDSGVMQTRNLDLLDKLSRNTKNGQTELVESNGT